MKAIAISHPHYYTTMRRWSEAFDAPVLLHEADRQWVVDDGEPHRLLDGRRPDHPAGLTLIRCGGHFAGGTVLHRADGGGGTLFSGDMLQVLPDRRHVSFMRSYPNMIPLSAPVIERILARLSLYRFERIYGAFAEREILAGGAAAVARSAERYIASISGRGPPIRSRERA